MNLWEMVKVALEGIWANKLRSGLTMLGIIIGVLAVIIVVTIAQGGQSKIMSEMESAGSNMFFIWVGTVDDGDYGRYKMNSEDCKVIKASVNSIRSLVPVGNQSAKVGSRRKKVSSMITGTEAEYASMHNIEMQKGRFFNTVDSAVARRVMVINQKLADELFGTGGDAVGQRVFLGQVPVMVIGVCKTQSSMFQGGQENAVAYIPIKLFYSTFNVNGVFQLEGSAVSKDQVEEASRQTLRILQLRHGDKEKKVYLAFNMEQEMQAANKITGILTLIIGAIAGISLLVGGIGVMNIMLVSVTERTREIGIRIAVGARRQDIMVQFLIEAIVLAVLGGIIGMALGIGGSALICAALKFPVIISAKTIMLAVIFSMAVGVFFGIYPANRAARLDPIESLRYE